MNLVIFFRYLNLIINNYFSINADVHTTDCRTHQTPPPSPDSSGYPAEVTAGNDEEYERIARKGAQMMVIDSCKWFTS